ncbi:hypothetical protein [Bacillus sp. Marseille-P3661]|uniref:hypothetical protein n=1 Tax=Bacillus sp. Marseille-P3661 TaxID=1936234 RepID=UPI000C82B4A4|nr:hypothetical protein [Bacillus sp. Marseille-P3661]
MSSSNNSTLTKLEEIINEYINLDILSNRSGEHGAELSQETIQKLLTLAVKLYVSKIEKDEIRFSPFDQNVSATEVMITVSAMLKAADVELFELGLWQSWN